VSTDLAKCKVALEKETLRANSAQTEKDGLWEEHDKLVVRAARLQVGCVCEREREAGVMRAADRERGRER